MLYQTDILLVQEDPSNFIVSIYISLDLDIYKKACRQEHAILLQHPIQNRKTNYQGPFYQYIAVCELPWVGSNNL